MLRKISPCLLAILALTSVSVVCRAADWPTYGGNARRTGAGEARLSGPLSPCWTRAARHAPRPAWPRDERMRFDRAHHLVADRQRVIFGDTVDGTVRALDARTGEELWTYYTEGPVRFAPTIWKDRIFATSDDGHLRAVALDDGRLLWKRRGGPDTTCVLGNEVMISKWPARGGAVVVDDTVYFAAGIWPSEGIYLHALDAATGETVWTNDDSGGIRMPQPHGGAEAFSGVSAQGYLVAAGTRLLVPTGRAVPAAFDRENGRFEYFHLQRFGHNGGADAIALENHFLNNGLLFRTETGEKTTNLPGTPVAATADRIYRSLDGTLEALKLIPQETPDRRGEPTPSLGFESLWKSEGVDATCGLIAVADRVVAGGEGSVTLVDLESGEIRQRFEVAGKALGLAAIDDRLLVSTDTGNVYCFGNQSADPEGTGRIATTRLAPNPYDDGRMAALAEEVIRESGITEGYCLDLGCGDGALAYELARRTRLRICAVDDDPQVVDRARRDLTAAGVYGSRVTVHLRELGDTGLPRYCANLIVSQRSAGGDAPPIDSSELDRLQRPYGGVVCFGKEGAVTANRRGALPGAGQWTHQYADAANTLNSADAHVRGQLGMLWFRDVDFEIPQRHGRAPAPLFENGRLFHEGLDGIVAVDAYNGRELWRYDIPGVLRAYDGDELMGTAGTGSNFCVHQGVVYARDGDRCLRIDAQTGTLLGELRVPADESGKPPGPWAYIGCVDGVLYGTEANPEHVVTYRYVDRGGDMSRLLTESKRLFAIDVATGEVLWQYEAEHSVRNNTIAVARGKVFVVDRPLADFDRRKNPDSTEHAGGKLITMDARSGETVWTNDHDVYGTMLAVSEEHDALLMSYQPTRFRLDSEVGGRLSVFQADSGKPLWEVQADYASRPLLNDRTVYAQGGAWDLLTGEPRPFNFSRSYGCGILSGCRDMVLYRSATLGYFDLKENESTRNYGGLRPGCWVNIIPAGGVVLVPDASQGCRCSYLNKAWMALEPIAAPPIE